MAPNKSAAPKHWRREILLSFRKHEQLAKVRCWVAQRRSLAQRFFGWRSAFSAAINGFPITVGFSPGGTFDSPRKLLRISQRVRHFRLKTIPKSDVTYITTACDTAHSFQCVYALLCAQTATLDNFLVIGESQRSGAFLMARDNATIWYHSNRYAAQSACEHCKGIIRHHPWCITVNPAVYYANEIILNPDKLTMADTIILHSLGVTWSSTRCEGACKKNSL